MLVFPTTLRPLSRPAGMVLRGLLAAAVVWMPASGAGQEVDDSGDAYQLFENGSMDVRTLAEVVPMLADAERRTAIREKIVQAEEPPKVELVALLEYPSLAVRLGALELLEEMAGGDFSYNPWETKGSTENQASLARWKEWAGHKGKGMEAGSLVSEERRRGYLRDLLGTDPDKAARARRMLEVDGLEAVGFLENHLVANPTLPEGMRARIREAQYQVTLARQLGDQAAQVARNLCFGSRDQTLSALASVRDAGMFAIPILANFIDHPDSLVRETAIDSLLLVAGSSAIPIIGPKLKGEADVNVIHGAMRRLKDIRGMETEKLVAHFLTHPDEDLLVSAIQTSLTLSGDNDRFSSYGSSSGTQKPKEANEAILKCLDDPRWRVRAAALEFVAKRKLTSAKERVLVLLDDDDSFVRHAAALAVVAMRVKEALPTLKGMLMADPESTAFVVQAYIGMGEKPDQEMLAKIDSYPPQARIALIDALRQDDSMVSLLLRYAEDGNLDVSCVALRAIAADEELLGQDEYASLILRALRDKVPEKVAAILEQLDLPMDQGSGSSSYGSRQVAYIPDGPTTLDALYEAFRVAEGEEDTGVASKPVIKGAATEIIKELAQLCSADTPPPLRYTAIMHLVEAGEKAGLDAALRDLDTYTTAQKTNLCDVLGSVKGEAVRQMLKKLLADPVSAVRSAAAECAFSDENDFTHAQLVLEELVRDGALLLPDEVYNYGFDYSVRENLSKGRDWAQKVLDGKDFPPSLVVLACVMARHGVNASMEAALLERVKSESPLVRRAAWHALLSAKPSLVPTHAKAIAEDREAFVRVVLPDRITRPNYVWEHRFTDTRSVRDDSYSSESGRVRADAATKEILAGLAGRDPAPLVRFEAGLAMLELGESPDLDGFIALLPKLSKNVRAAERISSWLQDNAARATPALRPLLGVADLARMDASKRKMLEKRVNPGQGEQLASFSSLAAMASDPAPDGGKLLAAAPEKTERRTTLEVVYFYKPGCKECTKTKEVLQTLGKDFPGLRVKEHNILEGEGLVLNQALCDWFQVPVNRQNSAPAVFAQAGFVIGSDLSPAALGTLFSRTMDEPVDDSWMKVSGEREKEAVAAVETTYENRITLPIVLLGGLLDGINPCAFATIIFFLSYLQIARRSPREMLMVGAAFVSAVFLAYFAAGLVLYQIFDSVIARFAGVQKWMNLGFGLLALVAAWLSFRDALRARAGRMEDMTLQLPGLLKDRIRGVVRTGARARRFVIAAFVAGVVISFLELACTGQVYAPIIYQIQKGRVDAVWMLALYNLAFVTPLIVVFLLAYGGLRSEVLIGLQKRHTFAVKVGLGILFLGLAAVILLGDRLW